MRGRGLVAALAACCVALPAAARDRPAFPHGMSLFAAAGYGTPLGTVKSLPGDLSFPETDAGDLYRSGPAFGAAIAFYDERWMFELDVEGRAFGLLTDEGKELARPLGFLDADSSYLVFEISAGRWHPLGRSAMIFATIGNGLILQRLGEDGVYFHDNQYGLSLRAGVGWIPGERLIVRPYVRYQAITKNVPNDLALFLGIGVALGRDE